MNQSTSPKLIFLVVCTLALLTIIGMVTICLSLFVHVYADASIVTATLTLTSTFGGALTGLLINTRSGQGNTATTQTTTTQTAPDGQTPPPATVETSVTPIPPTTP